MVIQYNQVNLTCKQNHQCGSIRSVIKQVDCTFCVVQYWCNAKWTASQSTHASKSYGLKSEA